MRNYLFTLCTIALVSWAAPGLAKDIIHDAEYYIIEAQNGERWLSDDKKIDARLAQLRKETEVNHPTSYTFCLTILVSARLACRILRSFAATIHPISMRLPGRA